MGVAEGAAASDAWPRARQPRFTLRRGRIQPGPLKSLDRRSRRPAWAAGVGLLGLSLVATWAVASQIRTGVAAAEQVALVVRAEPVQEADQPVRVVGAAQVPQAAPAGELLSAVDASLPPSAAPVGSDEPQAPAPVVVAPAVPIVKPASKPAIDLGSLPVLKLDETAFDTVLAPDLETTSQAPTRAYGRP